MAFHVNPLTGNAGRCSAKAGQCPFGGDEDHYSTVDAARAAYERSQPSLFQPAGAAPVVNASSFSWYGEEKSFSIEASELRHDPTQPFVLSSQKSDEAVLMVPAGPTIDDEGDVLYWSFSPEDPSKDWHVKVFND